MNGLDVEVFDAGNLNSLYGDLQTAQRVAWDYLVEMTLLHSTACGGNLSFDSEGHMNWVGVGGNSAMNSYGLMPAVAVPNNLEITSSDFLTMFVLRYLHCELHPRMKEK